MSEETGLQGVPLFSGLEPGELASVTRRMPKKLLRRGEYAYLEGAPPDHLGIVMKGRVKLVKHSDEGKDLTLEVLSPGEAFGITSVCEGKPHLASAQAVDDETEVVLLTRDDLCQVARRVPEVALRLVSALGRRLERAYENMQALASQSVERRIANNLLNLAAKFGVARDGTILIDLPLTRQDLADLSGTTVETTIRIISKLRERGILRTERERVVILEAHQLVSIAEDW